MPGLIACGRRWGIGSDDLFFPATIELVIRTAWLTGIVAVFVSHADRLWTCPDGHLLAVYYSGMLVVLSLHIVTTAVEIVLSTRGSITHEAPRRHMAALLYGRLALVGGEVVWTALGTYWAFCERTSACERHVLVAVKVAVIVGWLILVALVVGLVVVFDPLGGSALSSSDDDLSSAAARLWKIRCNVLCCCVRGDDQTANAFEEISQVFTNFFKGVDIVPTDVAAGFVLLHAEQKRQHRDPRLVPFNPLHPSASASLISPTSLQPSATLVDECEISRAASPTNTSVQLPTQSNASLPTTGSSVPTFSRVKPPVDNNVLSPTASCVPAAISVYPPTDSSVPTDSDVHSATASSVHSAIDISVHSPTASSVPTVSCVHSATDSSAHSPTVSSVPAVSCLPLPRPAASSEPATYPCPAGWMTTQLAAHYMRFAAASYGWPLYVYSKPATGLCALCGHCGGCCCDPSTSALVFDDNCCSGNVTAILRMTGISIHDVIYASFYNRVFEVPFYVALDHKHRAVVVSIRGTLSLRDAITDLTAHSECLQAGEAGETRAHKGILQAACYVKTTLENMQLLETAFQKGQGYRLVLTGHSLGAGAAALLAVFLREKYPALICYAFSPPSLVCLPLSKLMRKFVLSVVVNKDFVARLSIISVELIKVQLLSLIRDTHTPKYQLLVRGCWNAICGTSTPAQTDRTAEENSLLEHTTAHNYHSVAMENPSVHPSLQSIDDAIAAMGQRCDVVRLYVPGHILYLQQDEPVGLCCGTPAYTAAWALPEMFDQIEVSPRMLIDHLPDVVLRAIDQVADHTDAPCFIAQRH